MITRPSQSQVLLAIRQELADVVAPTVTTEQARIVLQMVDNLLWSMAQRSDDAAAMTAEIDTAAALGDRVAAEVPAAAGVTEALAALRGSDDDLVARYDLAGELLSRCIETTMPVGGDLHAASMAALQQRLDRELHVMGEFAFVGRG